MAGAELRGWSPRALLLLLCVSGSWDVTFMEFPTEYLQELRKPGQTLFLQCPSQPQSGPYVNKTWCRQTSSGKCTRLVTTSKPRTAVENSPHKIWDDPEAGFFLVTVTGLREEHSGVYVCGNFNSSHRVIGILRNVSLVVSPDRITSPKGTADPSINGSGHRKPCAHFSFDPASPGFLLCVQCGLLVVKGLVLIAAWVLLDCRRLSWGS